MRRAAISLLAAATAVVLIAPAASARPSVKIRGSLAVGSTVSVKAKGGSAKRIAWERCPTPVTNNTCASPVRIGTGRSITLDSSSSGLSIRATAKVRGRKLATRWSAPVGGGSSNQVVVPNGWVVTGGSPSNVTSNQREISAVYAQIAQLVGGGRFLSHFESAGGGGGILIQRELTLCSSGSFRFVDAGVTDATGTWKMTVNFTNPNDIAPRLVLTVPGGSETSKVSLNASKPGHVFLENEDFLSTASSSCQ